MNAPYADKCSVADAERKNLRADCADCFGFCCAALFFSASDGFPADKQAGDPCPNLQQNFKCRVYNDLGYSGLKGCTAYDCLGAGQKTAQKTFGRKDWWGDSGCAKQMFEVFRNMRQLHEILWYLAEAFSLNQAGAIKTEIAALYGDIERASFLDAASVAQLDAEQYRTAANVLLRQASERTRKDFRGGKSLFVRHKTDLIGADLKGANLRGADLRGALLIAADLRDADLSGADLIGADLRDADIRGADIAQSIFLTQMQVNAAKGDAGTRLPGWAVRPADWGNCKKPAD